jgi:uncharacterized repeat protein (TIGR01451 family)
LCAALITALSTSSLSAAQSGADRHKLQVNDPALAARLLANGARLIADYGAFQLLETSEYSAELQTNSQVELRDSHNLIRLNAAILDTTPSATSNTAAKTRLGAFGGQRLHLVQFVGPVTPEWRNAIATNGVQIVTYIPNNAYLISGDRAGLAAIQSLAETNSFIQWEGIYSNSYKIHPRALSAETNLFMVQLLADAQGNSNSLRTLSSLSSAPFLREFSILKYHNLVVQLPTNTLSNDLVQIATLPDVISIHPYSPPTLNCERQDQIIAGNLSSNVPNGPGYLSWLAAKGFTQAQFDASGFVVDVSDSGIDNGTTSPSHPGLHKLGARTNASRVAYARLEGTANDNSTISGCDGHGNLNAHIIAGYCALSNWPHLDSLGYHYGLGVCPFVKIGSSVVFDPSTNTNPDYTNLMARAYNNGARISNNSWGDSSARGGYNADSQAYDALVRDAQMSGATYSSSGNQGMVIVFSAGNDGESGTKTITAPGTAKNVITVGAAEGVQAFGGSDGSGIDDTEADSANDIVAFSSRGPCQDGRHKPDLVAPGTHISGGVPQASSQATNGTALSCYTGEGVSGGTNGSAYYPPKQQFYTASSGTSHAAPCVSGGCALLRQYFINTYNTTPSPAMTKAYLMNSARYLNGANAKDSLWSNRQGMGEMNLGAAFDGVGRVLHDQHTAEMFTASGQTRAYTGTIADSSKPFRVTLAWTDAPGSTAGNALNNDLDLTVTVGGKTYKGNVFNGAYSTNGGSADTLNNVESVFLPAGTSGNYTVTVTATDINSDGVPNNSYSTDQDFALVIYNSGTGPSISAVSASLTAEDCSPANSAIDPGEIVTLEFALANYGNADTTNLTATLLASNGIVPLTGAQLYGALSTNGTAVSRAFTFTATGSCGNAPTALLQLTDGAASLGTIGSSLQLGVTKTSLSENFDSVTAPALPSGWSAARTNSYTTGSVSNWTTAGTAYASSPNAARVLGTTNAGTSYLISQAISIATSTAQLTFQNNYSFETQTISTHSGASTNAYDGGVLEIQIGSAAFTDILTAGGSFISGGYIRSIYAASDGDNPLGGRKAWSGSSGGFMTTAVLLPASAAGQNIRLRWVLATDSGNSYGTTAWYIDSVTITDGYTCCTNGAVSTNAQLSIRQSVAPASPTAGQKLTYTLTVTNSGNAEAANVILTDTLPDNLAVLSNSTGDVVGSTLTCPLGMLASHAATNVTVSVTSLASGLFTNLVVVTTDSAQSSLAGNTNLLVTTVAATNANQYTVAGVAGTYAGLFYDTNGVALTNAGFFTATLAKAGTFSSKYQFAGKSYTASGKFSSNGLYSASLTNKGAWLFSTRLQLDLAAGNRLTGFLSNAAWTAELNASRNIYSKTNPASQGGSSSLKYTLLIPGIEQDTNQPWGSGYGTLTVNKTGTLSFAGVLADGAAVSQGSFLSPAGEWPLFAALYSGKGLLIGWITFATNEPASDLSGLVAWIKPISTAKYYPLGFGFTNTAIGSLYRFTNGSPLLSLTNGALVLESPELAQSITNALYLGANNKFTASNKLSLKLTTSSGLFTGTGTNRLAGKAIAVKGVIFQKQNLGAGYFLGTNQSGKVSLGNP